MRRRTLGSKKLVDKEIRFTSSTSWTIPAGCKSIDIFLVGGGGADRNRDNGNGGESDYDEGCGTGQGTRKSGGYGGGGCGSYGTGGDGTVLIRYYAYKE